MKTSPLLKVLLVMIALGSTACGVKVESPATTIPLGQTGNQQLEADLQKNPLLTRHWVGTFGSIQINTNGGTQISVRRTCDAGNQYCDFMGQPAQDSFVLDLGTPSGYSEKIENGQAVSVSMTGGAQSFTLNEVLTANGLVVSAVNHVMIYSDSPCGSNVKGAGMEDRTQIKTYFDGSTSTSAGCQALY